MTARQVFGYWPSSIQRTFRIWWNTKLERRYLMCAEVEQQRANEHQRNVSYYQKQAVFARANQR